MLTWRIALTNGIVVAFGDAWLDPDGNPPKGPDGMEIPLSVGGIFFQPELIENVPDDDPEEEGETQSNPACYLVFARLPKGHPLEAAEEARVRRYFLDGNILYAEEAWPAQMANDFVKEEIEGALRAKMEAAEAARQALQQAQAPAQAQPQAHAPAPQQAAAGG